MDMKKKNKTVITIREKEIDRDNAKLINGKFYEIDVDCFKVEGSDKWQRIDNGKIAFNFEEKRYEFIESLLQKGFVQGYAEGGEELVYFKYNPYENVVLKQSYDSHASTIHCISSELALKLGYIEHLGSGEFYKKANLDSRAIKACNTKTINSYRDKKINYNANEHSTTFNDTVRDYNSRVNIIPINERTRLVSKILGNYSFGLEFETSDGFIPSRICNRLGLVPLKDGSLRHNGKEPYEFTSVPLRGERGLETLKLECEELMNRCELSQQCSLHLHVGLDEYGTNMEFLLALYILSFRIQGDLFNLFPDYKKDPQEYLGAEKNYCKALSSLGLLENDIYNSSNKKEINDKILKNFNKIFEFLCDNLVHQMDGKYNLNTFVHPQGETKWHRNARYYHINLMNTVFSPTRTVEFRLHTPSFNFTKTSNWLFICVAIIRYAKAYSKEIISGELRPTLTDVLRGYDNFFGELKTTDYSAKEIADYLIDYCNFRTKEMKICSEKGDVMGKSIELKADKTFSFDNGRLKTIY